MHLLVSCNLMQIFPFTKLECEFILHNFPMQSFSVIVERTTAGKAIARQKPGYRDGRPEKFSKTQIDHALSLLGEYSYTQVANMTGISKSTLLRAKRKRDANG